jgi:signal transduction histidine kinase
LRCELTSALPSDTAIGVFRILQQGLSNIAAHARASRVELSLCQAGGQLTVELGDDGVGFDPGKAPPATAIGLRQMRERAGLLGGWLQVVSMPGAGTRLSLALPDGSDPHSEAP